MFGHKNVVTFPNLPLMGDRGIKNPHYSSATFRFWNHHHGSRSRKPANKSKTDRWYFPQQRSKRGFLNAGASAIRFNRLRGIQVWLALPSCPYDLLLTNLGRYLEEDPAVTVLAHRQRLEGYEVYLVEQWACSRERPTFIITTYTGDPKDSVVASVLGVPTDESKWSPRLTAYFKALAHYHARRKETPLGTLMITNLSGFPSSLTVIPVPEGDVIKYRELFLVNENLKRLGCSGRLGIKLAPPNSATQAKFQQLYKTNDKIPLNGAVVELVKCCQIALVLFDKLAEIYADGLLCDVTERAINDWWVEFGAEYYSVEPHDGILGPTTVAGLLGMLMGARNRLSAYNAPVSKDVFEIENMKRGIAYFQKTQRMEKTRRLDRITYERLRRATAKAASGEGWTMPRALKSTVAELSGKSGEMMMGMVGGRDKAGIADVETVDIDRFIDLVRGNLAKWLWYGKPRKHASGTMFSRLPLEEPQSTTEEPLAPIQTETTLEGVTPLKNETTLEEEKQGSEITAGADGAEKDTFSKRAVLKRATGKIEAGSGFGRIKDAVGRRTHHSKTSKDENDGGGQFSSIGPKQTKQADANAPTQQNYSNQVTQDETASSVASPTKLDRRVEPSFTSILTDTPEGSNSALTKTRPTQAEPRPKIESDARAKLTDDNEYDSSKPPTVEGSVSGSVHREVDLPNLRSDDEPTIGAQLRRTQSSSQMPTYQTRNDNWWPRRLSFSIAEDSILTWRSIVAFDADMESATLEAEYAKHAALTFEAKRLRELLTVLRSVDAKWAEQQIGSVQELNDLADHDLQELDDMYYHRLDSYHALREDAHEVVSRERLQLQEAVRDVETLGAKLEYEINALRGKVDDVEDGVEELERQVGFVEERVRELEDVVREKEGWVHWAVRLLTGIGSPPVSGAALS